MRRNDPNEAPSPDQLAAYFDGALGPAARARVAEWLAAHPKAAADLEAQRMVPPEFASPPPEPSEAAWSSVLERIDERTQVIKARQRRERLGRFRGRLYAARYWLGAGAAAAVVAALLLYRPAGGPPAPEPHRPQVVKALPVASDDDVQVISMEAGDARTLVVGQSPLPRHFALAQPGDVWDVVIEPDADGVKPRNMNDGAGGPMIIMQPLALNKP